MLIRLGVGVMLIRLGVGVILITYFPPALTRVCVYLFTRTEGGEGGREGGREGGARTEQGGRHFLPDHAAPGRVGEEEIVIMAH